MGINKRKVILCLLCCIAMMFVLTACSVEYDNASGRSITIETSSGQNQIGLTNVRFHDMISGNFIDNLNGSAYIIWDSYTSHEVTITMNYYGTTYTLKLSERPVDEPDSFILYTNSTYTVGDLYEKVD